MHRSHTLPFVLIIGLVIGLATSAAPAAAGDTNGSAGSRLASLTPQSLQPPTEHLTEATPRGFWMTEDGRWTVAIDACTDGLCGRVVGLSASAQPDVQRTDSRNRDPVRRTASLCGLPVLGGFKPSGDEAGAWNGGWVYDPEDGETYKGDMKLEEPNTLDVRGYVAVELFGRSEKLARVSGPHRWCSKVPGVATGA